MQIHREDVVARLTAAFSPRELALIEAVFEGYNGPIVEDWLSYLSTSEISDARRALVTSCARTRLDTILRVIIESDGEFTTASVAACAASAV